MLENKCFIKLNKILMFAKWFSFILVKIVKELIVHACSLKMHIRSELVIHVG
jgi:hypothetical protein